MGDLHDDICECAANDDYDTNVWGWIIIIPTACIPTKCPVRRNIITRSIGICQITTSIIIPAIIVPPIRHIAPSSNTRHRPRNRQCEPENEIASDVRAWVYPSIAREEDDDVDDVPDDGEAEGDDHPGEENGEGGVEVISIALEVVEVVFVVVVAVVSDGCRPGYGADGYGGEEDSEDAEEEFPKVGGVVVAYCCS